MFRNTQPVAFTPDERRQLEVLVRRRTARLTHIQRARILLASADGTPVRDMAKDVGVSTTMVTDVRRRWRQRRMDSLDDAPRSGRHPRLTPGDMLTLVDVACHPPDHLSHHSTRTLAVAVGARGVIISKSHTHRVLQRLDIKPHQQKMWCTSTDPEFAEKQAEVVGLYMNPPENALVFSMDEKPHIQALRPQHPDKPLRPGLVVRRDSRYARKGTTDLFAAMDVHSGAVYGRTFSRHSHVEFLEFVQDVTAQHPEPEKELHFVMDNLSAHKTREVREWSDAQNGRVKFHFTPTHASWLNMIELWFALIQKQLLKRGAFESVEDVNRRILAYIEDYNRRAKPFRWVSEGKPLRV